MAEILACEGSSSSSFVAKNEERIATNNKGTWLRVDQKGNQLKISYELIRKEQIRLNLFTQSGKLIAQVLHKQQTKGQYGKSISSRKLPAGIYHLVLQTDNEIIKERIILVK